MKEMHLTLKTLFCLAGAVFIAAAPAGAQDGLSAALPFRSALRSAVRTDCGTSALPRAVRHPALGPVYRAAEPDFLALLEDEARRAQASGEWDRRHAQTRRRLLEWSDRPVPGIPSGALPRADRKEVRRIATPYAQLKTELARTLEERRRGLTLEAIGFDPAALSAIDAVRRTYVFVDADDRAQRLFAAQALYRPAAETRAGTIRIVLLKGSLSAMRTELIEFGQHAKRPTPGVAAAVYFDQAGRLRRLFQVTSLPAVVTLEAEAATVEVFPIDDEGRPIDTGAAAIQLPDAAMPLEPAVLEAAKEALKTLEALYLRRTLGTNASAVDASKEPARNR